MNVSIVMHEGEKLLAPTRKTGATTRPGNNCFVTGIVDYCLLIQWRDLPKFYCCLEFLSHVGLLHETKAELHTNYSLADGNYSGPLLVRYARRLRSCHGDKQNILVQNAVAFSVV